jgi:hypothetical protein
MVVYTLMIAYSIDKMLDLIDGDPDILRVLQPGSHSTIDDAIDLDKMNF